VSFGTVGIARDLGVSALLAVSWVLMPVEGALPAFGRESLGKTGVMRAIFAHSWTH